MHGAGVRRCSHEGCPRKVIVGGVCITHGARVLRCRHKGCKNQTVKGGVCRRHGAPKSFCNHKGCKNAIVKGGVCRRHGATRRRCSHEGCTNAATKRGVCKGLATRGAPTTPKGEDSAMGMENISARESRYVAARMDAPANPKGEEFARSTVRSLSSPPRGKWSCPLRPPRVPRTRPRLPWREEGWKSKCTIRPMTRKWVRGF